ncbi:MAG: hypothetical protein EPO61_04610 [Nitrospirae bacterium]|nr:MAG: hypothetical protein EPO61_04610 [Nitrospirota bacterium]
MLSLIVLAASLYVCPGGVYADHPEPGCKPFTESQQHGFSTKEDFPASPAAPVESRPSRPQPSVAAPSPQPVGKEPSAAASELCDNYREWVALSLKQSGGGLTPQEVNRWNALRGVFGTSSAPPVKC